MSEVDLVYYADCPNVSRARDQLLRAFAQVGLEARFREWRADDAEAPPRVRGFGSPTILVDGRDVAGAEPVEGARSCRLYGGARNETRGAPSVDAIVAALLRSAGTDDWKAGIATLPAVSAALFPKVACPACWPAYAGFLSSIGLGLLLDSEVILTLTAVFLSVSVFTLAFRARRRHGYGPFFVGLSAAGIVVVGKFVLPSDVALYGGLAVIVASSVWNGWPLREKAHASPACACGESTFFP